MASNWPQTLTFTLLVVVGILLASTPSNASSSRGYYDNNYSYEQPSYTYTYQPQEYSQPQEYHYPVQEYKPYYSPPSSPAYKDGESEQRSYSGTPSDKAAFMQVHNDARSAVGLPPFTWDDRLASFAQSWANQRINDCRLVHSNGPYGENIFWGSGGYSAAFGVQSWVNERKYYDLYSNSCAGGMDCGHYTQIVWRSSTRIGCARVTCNDGGVFITCNYDPPGNYIGTKPY